MKGTCKLCGNEGELEESHFIPKFIGKWVKNTSITGYLRDSVEVYKRVQDTAKEYWLCGDCEDKFSVWETKFANKIFHPFMSEGKFIASYEQWMSKFCASLSWRTLTYIRSINTDEENPQEYYDAVNKAEKHLANYLLDKVDNLNEYEQHFFPLEKIVSDTSGKLPVNINRYLLRNMAMDIIGNDSDIMTYTKLPSFIILGFIKVKEPKKMRSSRVSIKTGKISPRDYYFPDGFINYIIEKAQAISDAYEKIPEKHLEKIENYVMNNPEKVLNSKLFEAFLHDYEMFGNDALKK